MVTVLVLASPLPSAMMNTCLFAQAGRFTVTAPAEAKSVTTTASDVAMVTGVVVALRTANFWKVVP